MGGRRWKAEDEQTLRTLYGTLPPAAIGSLLGRPKSQVVNHAQRLGLQAKAPPRWRAEEVRTLRELYGRVSLADLAAKLSRPRHGVQQKARMLGLTLPAEPHPAYRFGPDGVLAVLPDLLDQIRAFHADGYSDSEIAGRVGVSRKLIGSHRRSLGLASNRHSSRVRAKISGTCRRLALDDPSNGYERLARPRRDYASRSGWPSELPPQQVAILNLLAALGVPAPAEDLQAALKVRDRAQFHRLLLALFRADLVARVRAKPRPGVRGIGPYVYTLSPHALAIIEAKLPCERNVEKPA